MERRYTYEKKRFHQDNGCRSGCCRPSRMRGKEQNPNNSDKVSLLGFGCMRWPMIEKDGARVIDQEAVNEMVDYALAHGVNYFDTSPAYLMGQSERPQETP